jgi:hypothetical protein
MLGTIKDIVLINAYWFSLPFIGYSILRFVRDNKKISNNIKVAPRFILKQHPLTVFLISFTLMVLVCALASIFFYTLHLSVDFMAVLYMGALLAACLYILTILLRNLFNTSAASIPKTKDQILLTKILFFAMCLALLSDFIISLYTKSNIGGDTSYHLSRIVSILNDGFNVQSSFFSNLPESAYHYNVVYVLYAVASKILHLEPIRVWEYSLGFFRLLQWLAIFTLALHVFGNWLKSGKMTLVLSILSVISAMSLSGYTFFMATYPNQIVNIWLILLVICLSYPIKKNPKVIGVAVASLGLIITMTHPTYAFIAACFIALLVLIRLCVEKKKVIYDRTSVAVYAISVAILMAGPVITKLLPVRLSSDLVNLDGTQITNVLGMHMMRPIIPINYIDWVMLVAGVLGIVFLLVKLRKRKLEWSIVLASSSLFLIVAYIPIIFTIANHFLPVWLIERFEAINVLRFLLIPIGLYGVVYFIEWVFKARLLIIRRQYRYRITYIAVVLLALCFSFIVAPLSYGALVANSYDKRQAYAFLEQESKDFKHILSNNSLVVASGEDSYFLSSLFNIDVIAVEYGHIPLASDGGDRVDCQERILHDLNYDDLWAVNAKYVVIGKDLAGGKPYLRLIKSNQGVYVYEFKKDINVVSGLASIHQSCLIYQQKEKL